MNNSLVIHETILKDILDLWDNLKNISNEDLSKYMKSKGPMTGMSSIAKASSNMTLVFPVICSRAISIENASMVSKAIEKNAVTMLQRLFSSYNLSDKDDIVSYINQFHNNISSGVASLDDVFNLTTRLTENTHEYDSAIRNDMRNLDFYLPSSISESCLMRYVIKEGAATPNHKKGKNGVTNNYNGNVDQSKNTNFVNNFAGPVNNIYGPDPNSPEEIAARSAKNIADARKSASEYFSKQVLDSDFKKANELMPTTMTVSFKVMNKEGDKITDYDNALIAVKAKLYPVSSEDVVSHISNKTIDKNWLTNFFRATTREISFMKDFILALDKAKIDAMSLSTRKSSSDRMWKVLERRATNSRLKKIMRQNNNAAAITTLCISQEEVEYIRKYYNIDIERISTILGLFDSLNLMCVCIVDESLEVAKFIYDEKEPMWETISFTHLERESSDNTYKRVVNLMTKMR